MWLLPAFIICRMSYFVLVLQEGALSDWTSCFVKKKFLLSKSMKCTILFSRIILSLYVEIFYMLFFQKGA
jgi:hypothetical protein